MWEDDERWDGISRDEGSMLPSPNDPHGVSHLAAHSQRLVGCLKRLVKGVVLVGALVTTQVTTTTAQRE